MMIAVLVILMILFTILLLIAPETKRRLKFLSFDPKNYDVITIVPDDNEDVPIKLGPQNQMIFKRWNDRNQGVPCVLESINNNIPSYHDVVPPKTSSHYAGILDGMLYVKVLKTGSSTLAGINTRIATNYAKREIIGNENNNDVKCKSESSHEWYLKHDMCKRDKSRSFLWTVLRDPTNRAISEFFHLQVSRKRVEPIDENFKYYVRRYRMDYLYSLSCKGLKRLSLLGGNSQDFIESLIPSYDFIGISERFDESLVVLQLLLGLQTSDILYVPAKTSGNYDDGYKGQCHFIQPSIVSPEMKQFFQSQSWLEANKNNYELYNTVNKMLDNTIDAIGQTIFNVAYTNFMEAKRLVNEKCTRDMIKFPCTNDGIRLSDDDTDCYSEDWGCGYSCIDKLYHNATIGRGLR